MANITEDEVKNEWVKQLKIKQAEDKAVKEALKANKAAGLLKIKNDKVAENLMSSPFNENWRYKGDDIEQQWKDTGGWGFGVEDSGQGFFTPLPLAHHMFTEPTRDQLIQEVISNPELNKSDYERILGPDYETELEEWRNSQQQKQGLKINPPERVAMADKMYRVTDLDKKQNNEAWKQFMKGNPNYFYKPIKGRA